MVHLHGEISKLWCVSCGEEWEIKEAKYDRKGCPSCKKTSTVKPCVVFFGENAPRYSDLNRIIYDLRAEDTVIVIGTSGTVLPADRLSPIPMLTRFS